MRVQWRILAGLTALLVLAAACGSDEVYQEPAPTTTVPTAPSAPDAPSVTSVDAPPDFVHPSPEEMGYMVGDYVAFQESWRSMEGMEVRDQGAQLERIRPIVHAKVVKYFQDELQSEVAVASSVQEGATRLLGYPKIPSEERNAFRTTLHDLLGGPWPQTRYDKWNQFYDAFLISVDNWVRPQPMTVETMAHLTGSFKALRDAWTPQAELDEVMNSLIVDITAFLNSESINQSSEQAAHDAARAVITRSLQKGEIYALLGSPWPQSRYDAWSDYFDITNEIARTPVS